MNAREVVAEWERRVEATLLIIAAISSESAAAGACMAMGITLALRHPEYAVAWLDGYHDDVRYRDMTKTTIDAVVEALPITRVDA